MRYTKPIGLMVCICCVVILAFWITPHKKTADTKEKQEENRNTLYVLCAYETKLHQQILNEVADNYGNMPGTPKVKIEFIPKENFKKEICLRMDNGSSADLIICDNGMMPALVDMGVFADISDFVDADLRSGMNFPKLWNTTLDDGRCYGIPFTCDPYVLFYNKNALYEQGTEPPKSWEELLETCESLTEMGKYGFGFAAKRPEEIYSLYRGILHSYGGNLNTINQESGRKAAVIVEQLKKRQYIKKQTINLTEADVARLFADGEILMMANRLSASTILRSSRLGFEVGIAPLPCGVKDSLIMTGENIGVTIHADNDVYDFLDFLYENDIQERICNAMDTLPIKSEVPYKAKRVGPGKSNEFLEQYKKEGWCQESSNSWFEIAGLVSDSFCRLMEERKVSLEETIDELQGEVKLAIIRKR